MDVEVVPEAGRPVLVEWYKLDIVVVPVLGDKLTPPQRVDDIFGFRRAQELDGKLIDSDFEGRGRSRDVAVGLEVSVPRGHDARLLFERQGVDLQRQG